MVGALVGMEMHRQGWKWSPEGERPKNYDKKKNAAYKKALLTVLKKCGTATKAEALKVFASNKKEASKGKNWSAVPKGMKDDPFKGKSPKRRLPSYPEYGQFKDKKRFPGGKPKSGAPPKGKVWGERERKGEEVQQ